LRRCVVWRSRASAKARSKRGPIFGAGARARVASLAQPRCSVLFVCFNKPLRAHLEASVKAAGLRFSTFHALCSGLARRAKIALPDYDGDVPSEFWSDVLPSACTTRHSTCRASTGRSTSR
jgi:hypothetical protein